MTFYKEKIIIILRMVPENNSMLKNNNKKINKLLRVKIKKKKHVTLL